MCKIYPRIDQEMPNELLRERGIMPENESVCRIKEQVLSVFYAWR